MDVADLGRQVGDRARRANAGVQHGVPEDLELEPGDSLYGLYQGVPLPERSWTHGNTLPDRISIYQRAIEEDSEDYEDMIVCVAETVIHEFGHYFGLSEEEIEEIEDKYWRGEDLELHPALLVGQQLRVGLDVGKHTADVGCLLRRHAAMFVELDRGLSHAARSRRCVARRTDRPR